LVSNVNRRMRIWTRREDSATTSVVGPTEERARDIS
jgi:hypothetical protein